MMANKGENYSYIDLSPIKPVLKEGQYAVSYKAPDINLFVLTEAPIKSSTWYDVRTGQAVPFVFVKNWFYNGEGMWIFEGEQPELIGGVYSISSNNTNAILGNFHQGLYQASSDTDMIALGKNSCSITELTFPDGSGPSPWVVVFVTAPCVNTVLNNINFSSEILDVEGVPTVINMKIPNTVISIIPTPKGPAGGLGSDQFANNFTTLEVAEDNPIYDSRDNCNAVIETATNKLVMSSKNAFIPNSVTSLAPGSFWDCDIETLTIPNNIKSVADYAFANSNLKSVVWDVTTHSNFRYSVDPMCALFPSSLEEIEFGPNVQVIPGNLCRGTSIKEVYIPSTVDYVGENAFSPLGGSTITYLNSATIDSKTIGQSAFENCYFLKSLTIGNNVTSIGDYAFYQCSSLTSITIPNGVTSIGSTAFYGCKALTSITIPNSVTSIGENAFYGCSGLTSIVVEGGNTMYDSRENCNAIIETASNTLVVGCKNTIIPNSVTRIGGYAFFNCRSLTSITIPNSVTSIGSYAFLDCISLISISIPNSITSIGDGVFSGCSSLTSVTFNGTMEEWNNITKGSGWNQNVPATYVQCSDGNVQL